MYKVVWDKKAQESLDKLDFSIARRIKAKVETYLVNNPAKLGKPLKGEWQGHYRYRCFDKYRVIYQIRESELLIVIVKVNHRQEVY